MNPSRKQRVLVPVDLSERSMAALDAAATMILEPADLHVVNILPVLAAMHPGVMWETIDDLQRVSNVEQAIGQALAKRGLSGATVHVAVEPGNAAPHIADLARTLGINVVVLTSHGRTGLSRVTLGSVAERVVRLAPCSVLVVRE